MQYECIWAFSEVIFNLLSDSKEMEMHWKNKIIQNIVLSVESGLQEFIKNIPQLLEIKQNTKKWCMTQRRNVGGNKNTLGWIKITAAY